MSTGIPRHEAEIIARDLAIENLVAQRDQARADLARALEALRRFVWLIDSRSTREELFAAAGSASHLLAELSSGIETPEPQR